MYGRSSPDPSTSIDAGQCGVPQSAPWVLAGHSCPKRRQQTSWVADWLYRLMVAWPKKWQQTASSIHIYPPCLLSRREPWLPPKKWLTYFFVVFPNIGRNRAYPQTQTAIE